MALSQRMGIIKRWFGGEEGYGFIHPEAGGEAVFVHHTGIAAHATTEAFKGLVTQQGLGIPRRGIPGSPALFLGRAFMACS